MYGIMSSIIDIITQRKYVYRYHEWDILLDQIKGGKKKYYYYYV